MGQCGPAFVWGALGSYGWIEQPSADPEEYPCVDRQGEAKTQTYVQ